METGEIPALSETEIETEISREVETGEFEAVRRPETMDGSAGHPAPRSETNAQPPASRNQAVGRD